MPFADQLFGDVRGHQTDETDVARQRNRRGSDGDRAEQQNQFFVPELQSQGNSCLLTQRQNIQRRGFQEEDSHRQQPTGQDREYERPGRSPDVSRHPGGDETDVGPVRGGHQQDDQPRKGGGDTRSDDHQLHRMLFMAAAETEQVNRGGSHQRTDESDKRQDRRKLQHAFAREQIEDRHAEAGTGIDAQETRVGQVVVAQGLQDDTGTCQAGAGHRQHQSPGQADLVKDVVFFKNPVT